MRIIKINGFLYGLSENGRLRKNWKNDFYKRELPISDTDRCNKCGGKNNLTRHHDPPLRNTTESTIIILCNSCHVQHNWGDTRRGFTQSPFSIKCEICKSYRYFLPLNKIQCKDCFKTIHLKKIKKDEFEIVKSTISKDEKNN